jgi:hypothetical protein
MLEWAVGKHADGAPLLCEQENWELDENAKASGSRDGAALSWTHVDLRDKRAFCVKD